MAIGSIGLFFGILLYAVIVGSIIRLLFLCIKALQKYVGTKEMKPEQAATCASLGEALKSYRAKCNMTQEFVAQSLCVSRQAVSKWESGTSDPSTTNLLALAKLYGVKAEDILNKVIS